MQVERPAAGRCAVQGSGRTPSLCTSYLRRVLYCTAQWGVRVFVVRPGPGRLGLSETEALAALKIPTADATARENRLVRKWAHDLASIFLRVY
jgi:hypothetical protein